MNDLMFVNLRKAFVLIGQGLREKDELLDAAPERYPYSPRLMHGINMFLAIGYDAGKLGRRAFEVADEASFYAHYLAKPIADWFDDWTLDDMERRQLQDQPFYGYDKFVYMADVNSYRASEDCLEFLSTQDKDAINGTDERILYESLVCLPQEQYCSIRRYIIEHPIISIDDFREERLKYAGSKGAAQALTFAYEEFGQEEAYRCPVCGWTMTQGKYGLRCHSPHCVDTIPILSDSDKVDLSHGPVLRLKEGIMRYFAWPGKLELAIAGFCEKKKLAYSLWPQMDRYDIEIQFEDGKIWEIDAKAYRNPISLRNKIISDNGFPPGDFEKGYYVVPTEYTRNQTNYTRVVNMALVEQDDVRCVNLNGLKKEINRKMRQIEDARKG